MDTTPSLPDTPAEVNFWSFTQAGSRFHVGSALSCLKLHKTPIFPFALEWCERTISLTLNSVIKREIFTTAGNGNPILWSSKHKASGCAAWVTRPVNMKYLKLRHGWAGLCSQNALDLYSAFRCSIFGYDTGFLFRDFTLPLQENAMITSWLILELFYPAF
jgi:hypothetical protein